MIRTALEKDIEQLLEIYNYEVLNGVATFDIEPKTYEERREWFEEHTGIYPLLVEEEEGIIKAYGSLSPYRKKEAYKSTAELSIYVHQDYRGLGYGKKMMAALIEKAKETEELHTIVSVITGGNMVSDELHKIFGFTYCGRVFETGMKFGKYLDIDTYQLMV